MKKFLKLLVLPALVALTISCGQNASKQNAAAVSGETAEITSATDSTKADDRGYIVKVGDSNINTAHTSLVNRANTMTTEDDDDDVKRKISKQIVML